MKLSHLGGAGRAILATFAVTAGIVPTTAEANCGACSCSVSATNLNFGTYNPASSTPTSASASISVNCFSILVLMFGTVDVTVSAGTSGSAANRTLANGASRLAYNIYQDPAMTTVWGGTGSGGQMDTLAISGLLSYTATRTAYGRIAAGQWVNAGPYTDNLVVTVSY